MEGSSIDPHSIIPFAQRINQVYLHARDAISKKESSPQLLENIKRSLEAGVLHIRRLRLILSLSRPCSPGILASLFSNLSRLESRVGGMIERLSYVIPHVVDDLSYQAPREATGKAGRPSYVISKQQLEIMKHYRLSWVDISRALGVSISTIWRLRLKYGMGKQENKGRPVGGTELMAFIEDMQRTSPSIGIRMIEGTISARGLYASRSDIGDMLIQMNPVGAILRWNEQNPRIKYCVAGPNSLWHLDGNHKLIRWRLVIHGGIDGYSRMVVYLKCSSNNRADTVASLFLEATREYCWPSRVRTDKGGENAEVARLMIEHRGEGRGSIIQGSSVHNQRIERLWRDSRKMVVEHFRRVFYFLEEQHLLDLNSETDLFALHHIYIPRINQNLSMFKSSWNNHKLSSENNRTPNQLYILGMLALHGSDHTAVKDFFEEGNVNPVEYGVSIPDVAEPSVENINDVVVPEVITGMSENCLAHINAEINPLERDGNHGINLYIKTKNIIQQNMVRDPR